MTREIFYLSLRVKPEPSIYDKIREQRKDLKNVTFFK